MISRIRRFVLLLLPLVSSCSSAQSAIKYEVIGGIANSLCETYRDDLSAAVNTSSDGRLNQSAPFLGFEEISNIPVERMPGVMRTATDIGSLKLDLNNDGETEQLLRSIVMQITQRVGQVEGYKSYEFLSVFFPGYPKQRGSTDLPASALPYDPIGKNLNPWEDVIFITNVINPRDPKVVKAYPEEYTPQPYPYNSDETTTFIYQNNSRNYLSVNNHNLYAMEKDRSSGAPYFIKRSVLAEYDQTRKISVLCLIESLN